MSYDGAIRALAEHALTHVKDYSVVGLGSGRAASVLVRALGRRIKAEEINVVGIATSLQIKQVAEESGIALIEADQASYADVAFDGADQIDGAKYVIKGGGGALLRENIVFDMAKKVIVMADETKFAKRLDMPIPVEVHPAARASVMARIAEMGGKAGLRQSKYPFYTESGNLILDCDFGAIQNPAALTKRIKQVPGVLESGIFLRRPDVIYRAKKGSKFDVI